MDIVILLMSFGYFSPIHSFKLKILMMYFICFDLNLIIIVHIQSVSILRQIIIIKLYVTEKEVAITLSSTPDLKASVWTESCFIFYLFSTYVSGNSILYNFFQGHKIARIYRKQALSK